MYQIRKISRLDINEIAKIHLEAFPNFFLTTLGFSFLKCYYRAVINSKVGISVCVEKESEIIGFAVGTYKANGFHKNLIKNNFLQFSYQFIKIFFSKPITLIRLYKNLEKVPISEFSDNSAELLSIGIKESVKRTGVGKILLNEFEKEIINSNVNIITLTTDVYRNENVLNFYFRNGYTIYYEFQAFPNRQMFKLIKRISL